MGYHAPSAEEVYQYLFRLNRRSEMSLSDGFSWSILFMNDSSSLCREFLVKYGAELCYRTADRIRFVFFSNLEDEQLERSGSVAYRAGGFFTYIIERVLNRPSQSTYDLERDDWDTFRPEAFRPLETQERISQKISFEAQLYTAMPGSQEVHRLAQTLGIGRFVPCFLLFADIGDPTVRLFPIANKSPDEVYQRLRFWIDSFYEINRLVLAKWSSIEESIKQAVGRFNTSLSKVADWRRERKQTWDELQKLSKYLDRMAHSRPNTPLLHEFSYDSTLSSETKASVFPFLQRLAEAEQRQKGAREIVECLNRARTVTSAPLVNAELLKFRERCGRKLPESISTHLQEAITNYEPIELQSSPYSELVKWWHSEFGIPPSKKRYRKYRLAWVKYSQDKHGSEAVGKIAKIVDDEFTVARKTALVQPVHKLPEEAAQEVIDRLAEHLDVQPHDSAWLESTSDYRQILKNYFTALKNHAPAWLTSLESDPSQELRWGDCLPREEPAKEAGARNSSDQPSPLTQVLERATKNRDLLVQKMEAEQQERLNRSVTELFAAIDEWLAPTDLIDADKAAIWSTLVTSLSSARLELENRTFKNALAVSSASYPGDRFSEVETSELLGLLDEYDRAVQSIKFSFDADVEVLKVSLDGSLAEASGVQDRPIEDAAQEVKTKLLDVAEKATASARDWKSLQREAHTWSPAGNLWTVMTQVLNRSSLEEVLVAVGTRQPNDAPDLLASREKIICVLDTMPVQALTAIDNQLFKDGPRSAKGLPGTKQELYDSILLAIGLVPTQPGLISPEISADKAETLRNKVSNGVFDIFLAHNSQDRGLVLHLAQELRRQGFHPWVDVEQIAPGRWFQDVLQSAIRTVRTAAMVIGKSGVGPWQKVELRTFLSRCVEHGVPLIPVLLPGVDTIPDDLSFLRELHLVRFRNDVSEPEALSHLIWGITGEQP